MAGMNADRTALSVVIPCLNEAARLPLLLADLQRWQQSIEITIVDGGSSDGSQLIAAIAGSHFIPEHPPSRGRQLAAGAHHALQQTNCDWLFFLHADSRLPNNWRSIVQDRISQADAQRFAWFFDLRIDPSTPARRLMEKVVAVRSRWCQRPYGDQGLLLHRTLYERSGGYEPLPLMEDLDLVQRLSQLTRLRPLDQSIITDGRRWQRDGVLRRGLVNTWLRYRWQRGESPARLAAEYYGKPLDTSQLAYQKPQRWPFGSNSQPRRS
tara:strand:- start:12801 stop:13601 length:801 start_codon:yes stop_codon:yes gene_type:complete